MFRFDVAVLTKVEAGGYDAPLMLVRYALPIGKLAVPNESVRIELELVMLYSAISKSAVAVATNVLAGGYDAPLILVVYKSEIFVASDPILIAMSVLAPTVPALSILLLAICNVVVAVLTNVEAGGYDDPLMFDTYKSGTKLSAFPKLCTNIVPTV
jgi:hypothetical protein